MTVIVKMQIILTLCLTFCHLRALLIENEDGSQVRLRADNQAQRESVAKRLLTPSNVPNQTMGSKKVWYLNQKMME